MGAVGSRVARQLIATDPGVEVVVSDTDRERLERTSPLRQVDKIRVPLLLAYGELGERVDIKHARLLVAELKRHGKPYEFIVKNNEGHGFYREDNRIEFYRTLERFLAQHMR